MENNEINCKKIKYKVFEIVDDGDLKEIFDYKTDLDIKIGGQIARLHFDDTGMPIKRTYYSIQNIMYCIGAKENKNLEDLLYPSIYVTLLSEEDVGNGWN